MPTAAQKAAAASAIGGKGPPKPPKSAAPPDTYLDVQAARAKGPKGRQQRTPRAGAGSARRLPAAPASSTPDTSTTRDELELRFDLAGGKMIGLHLDEDNVVLKLDDGGLAAKDGRLKAGDRVVAVDGTSLDGRHIKSFVRGGQQVALRVRRGAPRPPSVSAPDDDATLVSPRRELPPPARISTVVGDEAGTGCWCCGGGGGSRRPTKGEKRAIQEELRRLHGLRRTAFEPDTEEAHERLLKLIWSSLVPSDEPYVRRGRRWKDLGFQGEDPATDVRGGGLLAVQCLAHFASLQTRGLLAMLSELENQSCRTPGSASYYPISTTAIVLCSRLCDAIGISNGMRGALPEAALEKTLASPPPPLARLLVAASGGGGRRGGFPGVFSLAYADFHASFVATQATYMESQRLLGEVVTRLEGRAAKCRQLPALHAAYVGSDAAVGQILDVAARRGRIQKLRAVTAFTQVLQEVRSREESLQAALAAEAAAKEQTAQTAAAGAALAASAASVKAVEPPPPPDDEESAPELPEEVIKQVMSMNGGKRGSAISALRLSVSRPELLSSMSSRDGFASPHASVSRPELLSSLSRADHASELGAIAEISLLIPAGVAIPPPPGSPYTSVRIEKPEKQTSYI